MSRKPPDAPLVRHTALPFLLYDVLESEPESPWGHSYSLGPNVQQQTGKEGIEPVVSTGRIRTEETTWGEQRSF